MTSLALVREGRHQPHASEAEVAVLGGIVNDGSAFASAVELLDETMFYREANRRVWRSMLSLFRAGVPIDAVTLSESLHRADQLELVGGMPFIGELMDAVPAGSNVEHHCHIVRDAFTRRKLIELASEILRDAYEPGERTTDEIVNEAAGKMLQVGVAQQTGGLVWLKKSLYPVFERIEELQHAEGGITGVPTGLHDLDFMTGGLQKGDLVIVAARPSMGKTSLVAGIALHAAITGKVPTAFYSMEMSRDQLIQRMLCYEGLVDLARLLRGKLTDDDYVRLAQATGHLNTAPIYIDDRGNPHLTQLVGSLRRAKLEHPDLGMAILDYAQLIEADGENRQQQVSKISRTLKGIAKELGIPVVLLSQLSRAPEQRADHRPQLSDLRESGGLEQDADLVMFLYRPEYYVTPAEAAEKELVGKAELIIGKQRNGPTGVIDLYFRKESTRFESVSHDWRAKI